MIPIGTTGVAEGVAFVGDAITGFVAVTVSVAILVADASNVGELEGTGAQL
jgi:hypothetical protein